MYKSHEAKAYAKTLKETYTDTPLLGELALTVWFKFKRDRDIDSGLKVLLDALQGVAYENDKQIIVLHVYKEKATGEPICQVNIDTV